MITEALTKAILVMVKCQTEKLVKITDCLESYS